MSLAEATPGFVTPTSRTSFCIFVVPEGRAFSLCGWGGPRPLPPPILADRWLALPQERSRSLEWHDLARTEGWYQTTGPASTGSKYCIRASDIQRRSVRQHWAKRRLLSFEPPFECRSSGSKARMPQKDRQRAAPLP